MSRTRCGGRRWLPRSAARNAGGARAGCGGAARGPAAAGRQGERVRRIPRCTPGASRSVAVSWCRVPAASSASFVCTAVVRRPPQQQKPTAQRRNADRPRRLPTVGAQSEEGT
ncbi:hypothetical protein GCM10023405_08500 [Streptomonospora salina]